jgi:hypothetical protein
MSVADWRSARRAAKATQEVFGDVEASAAAANQQLELGSSSGPEGAYELVDINNQQQQPVTPAQADHQQLPPQAEIVSAGHSSAPTVVGEASPKLASPVNETAQLDTGGDGPGGLFTALSQGVAGVLGGFGL